MPSKRPLMFAVAASLLLAAAPGFGLGFGKATTTGPLGAPLSFVIPLRLAPGEAFDPECLRADVQVGDSRLPFHELRWSVEAGAAAGERLVRVSTRDAINEPLVSVWVSSGCTSRISHRSDVLMQPPSLAAMAWSDSGAAQALAAPQERSLRKLQPAPQTPAVAPAEPLLAPVVPPSLALAAAPLAAPAPSQTGAPTDAVALAAADLAPGPGPRGAGLQGELDAQQMQLALLRQRLHAAEAGNRWLPWLVLGLLVLGALAAWLGLRLRRLLQDQQQQVRAQASASLQAVISADAAMAARGPLLPSDAPLQSAVAAIQAALDQPLLAPSRAAAPRAAAGAAAAPVAVPAVSSAPPTVVLAPPSASAFALGSGVPPRPVSVEELLDLDQQVDFFMALGQEQSAIELLLTHVRSTGGIHAPPYFKLLEIYRQQGDQESYERTRERFNQRFNAMAPDWSGDLAQGRSLEAYPEVVAKLQRAWMQPLRAVAELESMLLRRADLEPFDLPAYREILMLHALVRDLPAAPVPAPARVVPVPVPAPPRPAADGPVDLLLPLDEEPPSDITAPRPRLAERSQAQLLMAEWFNAKVKGSRPESDPLPKLSFDEPSRPARLDLDLSGSDFAPAPREFTRPAAFTDVDMRRDHHRPDLAAFDDSDLLPPPVPSRR